MKVKRFLDSLAYMFLIGDTNGIETDYKKVMHAKREIPASSCPTFIENMMFASGAANDQIDKEECASFKVLTDKLDARAEKYEAQKPVRKKHESLFHKRNRLGIHDGDWCMVDTDGVFEHHGMRYMIDESEQQYQPIETSEGLLYDMDRILVTGDGIFYDMNYDPVKVIAVSP